MRDASTLSLQQKKEALMSNESNTTDAIVHDPAASKGEKLDRLRDMSYELKRHATKNETSVDDVEAKVAEIKSARSRIESDK
jgi:hypothetical protein